MVKLFKRKTLEEKKELPVPYVNEPEQPTPTNLEIEVPEIIKERKTLEYLTVLGFDKEANEYRGVPLSERINMFLVGTTGVGKSTELEFLIEQDLRTERGFTLIDAHGDIVKKILARISPERIKDVVYISPLSVRTHQKVVKFNFLEPLEGIGIELVDRAFIDSLRKVHKEFWGPRLEMILINALRALREAMPGRVTVHTLSSFLSNPDIQREVLKNVYDRDVKNFWSYDYRKMPPDAAIAVQTKISKILQEPILVPLFDTERSTVNFRKLIDERKIIIIDLPEGRLSSDITNFLGSILLGRIYLAGMSREDIPEEKRVPHYIYIDESARFMSSTLTEILQALRKYKLFATLSVQDINQYGTEQFERDLRNVIPTLCSTICVFSSGMDTAKALEGHFKSADFSYINLMNIPFYRFYAKSSYGGEIHRGLFDTVLLPAGTNVPTDVIEDSLKLYGEKYEPPKDKGVISEISTPIFEPVIMYTLQTLWLGKECSEDDLIKKLKEIYGIPASAANYGLKQCTNRYLVDSKGFYHDSMGRETKKLFYFFSLTKLGTDTLYPPLRGPAAGQSKVHVPLSALAINECFRRTEVPIQTTGQVSEKPFRVTIVYKGEQREWSEEVLPDIVVWLPVKYIDEKGKIIYDPYQWDRKNKYIIEVETWPDHHPDRVIGHYERAKELGVPVVFVVSTERHAEYIKDLLTEVGAEFVDEITDKLQPGMVSIRKYLGVRPDPKTGVCAPVLPPDENMKRQVNDVLVTMPEKDRKVLEDILTGQRGKQEITVLTEEPVPSTDEILNQKARLTNRIKVFLEEDYHHMKKGIIDESRRYHLFLGRANEEGVIMGHPICIFNDMCKEILIELGIPPEYVGTEWTSIPKTEPKLTPKTVETKKIEPETTRPVEIETGAEQPEEKPEKVRARTYKEKKELIEKAITMNWKIRPCIKRGKKYIEIDGRGKGGKRVYVPLDGRIEKLLKKHT